MNYRTWIALDAILRIQRARLIRFLKVLGLEADRPSSLPPSIHRLSPNGRRQTVCSNGTDKDRDTQYFDPEGYWIDPARSVRRIGGEQQTVVRAADACSDLEWRFIFDAIRDCIPKTRIWNFLPLPSDCSAALGLKQWLHGTLDANLPKLLKCIRPLRS